MASTFKQRYAEKGRDGKRVRKPSKCRYIDYKDSDGAKKGKNNHVPRTDNQLSSSELGPDSDRMSADDTPKREMGRIGLEHPPLKPPRTAISTSGGAKSDARDAPKPVQDPDLTNIMVAWPELPEHIKAAVKALVQPHTEGAQE